MGNPVTRTYEAASVTPGPQTAVNLNYTPFGSTFIGVSIEDGTAAFSVEITLNDVNSDATVVWFTLEDIPEGTAETSYASFQFPAAFVRLNIESITGTVHFIVAQSEDTRA